jgi:DNA-binding protein HU-beta
LAAEMSPGHRGIVRVTQSDVVEEIARRHDRLYWRDGAKAVETLLEVLTDHLRAGDEINFLGFGTFRTTTQAARSGVNPQTGERISVPAKRVVKFKPGEALKRAVAGDSPESAQDRGRP